MIFMTLQYDEHVTTYTYLYIRMCTMATMWLTLKHIHTSVEIVESGKFFIIDVAMYACMYACVCVCVFVCVCVCVCVCMCVCMYVYM